MKVPPQCFDYGGQIQYAQFFTGTIGGPVMEAIPFAGSELGEYRHVCAFFNSPQEEYATLLPFVRDGLERGERAYHVLPARYRQEHLDQLRSADIDVRAAQQRRQLEVATPAEVYLRNGRLLDPRHYLRTFVNEQ